MKKIKCALNKQIKLCYIKLKEVDRYGKKHGGCAIKRRKHNRIT